MHRLESNDGPRGEKQRDRYKSTDGGNKRPNLSVDLFGALEMAMGDNFDAKDVRKFTGSNPAEWLIYKRICVSRISARACMDVIVTAGNDGENDREYPGSTTYPRCGPCGSHGHYGFPCPTSRQSNTYNTGFDQEQQSVVHLGHWWTNHRMLIRMKAMTNLQLGRMESKS
jgi:hypothetical protein